MGGQFIELQAGQTLEGYMFFAYFSNRTDAEQFVKSLANIKELYSQQMEGGKFIAKFHPKSLIPLAAETPRAKSLLKICSAKLQVILKLH
jgi:hypothetical protein